MYRFLRSVLTKNRAVVPWMVVGTPNASEISEEPMVSIYDHFRNDFHEQNTKYDVKLMPDEKLMSAQKINVITLIFS